jgi:signal transduction histidine kinase
LFKLFGFIQETEDQNTSGIGLGLMITKHIVDEYEGKIWVDSEPGIGSTFSLKLKIVEHLQLREIEVLDAKFDYKF